MKLSVLVGSGRKIGLLILPFAVVGIVLNILFPSFFSVSGPHEYLIVTSIGILVVGLVNWIWSVVLILTMIPKKKLITTGPYAIAKHPLYNGVAILVLPWIGILLNTWLGIVLGVVVLAGSKLFAAEEENVLRKVFGEEWADYEKKVLIKWL